MSNLRDAEKIVVIIGVVMASILGMGAYNLTIMNIIATETVENTKIDVVQSMIIIVVISAIVLAIAAMALLYTKRLDKLLQTVTTATEKVASGDLMIRSEELGDKNSSLVKAFDSMLVNLKTLITEVKITASSVSKNANTVAASTEQLNSGVEQISSTVQQISTGSQSQASDLSYTKTIVDAVTNNTEGTSASEKMSRIVELTKDSSSRVRGLAEKSTRITGVVEVIRDIAEKTNLLALNAAIEAARAGESGRGFAVVADEVRRLAEGSAKSSQEIDDLLREIQDEIKSTVTGIDESAKEVEAGRDVVEKSLQALENIGKKVQEISAVSEQNAAASEEASASVEQQTAATEDISTSSQSMASLAGELETKVAQFKLPGPNDNADTVKETEKPKAKKRSFKNMILKKEESIDELVQTAQEDLE